MADKSYKHFYDDGYTTYHYPSSGSLRSNPGPEAQLSQEYRSFTPLPKIHTLSAGRIAFAYVILAVIAVISYLYAGNVIILPFIGCASVITVDIVRVKGGDADRQSIWAHIVNLVMTAVFMFVVDHITTAPNSLLLSILFYLIPLVMVILSVCLNNTINNDEEFMFGYVFIMALTWFFRIIYKKNFPQIYNAFIAVASIVLVLMFVIILLLTIHSQRKKR